MFCRAVAALLFVIVVGADAVAAATEKLTLTNEQAVEVEATFYATEASLPPAVLIVADEANGGADAWAALARELTSRGKAVLVVSPRELESAARTPEDNLVSLVPAISDIRAGIRYVREREDIDGVRVAVIGAGDGARAALFYAVDDLLLSGLCLLSPLEREDALDTRNAVHQSVYDFGARPVLVMAGTGDVHAMAVADKIEELAVPTVRVVEAPGKNQGLTLLDGFGPRAQVLEWLDDIFAQP